MLSTTSLREVKIKTSVVKRITKELAMYASEHKTQQSRINKMVQAKEDEHEIRQQRKVLLETTEIIPDCEKRLYNAYQELSCLVKDSAENGVEIEEARKVLLLQQ